MTPKEKAKELYMQFSTISLGEGMHEEHEQKIKSKESALICIKHNLYIISGLEDSVWANNMKAFCEKVKEEIEKL